jgi:hypothetical protein
MHSRLLSPRSVTLKHQVISFMTISKTHYRSCDSQQSVYKAACTLCESCILKASSPSNQSTQIRTIQQAHTSIHQTTSASNTIWQIDYPPYLGPNKGCTNDENLKNEIETNHYTKSTEMKERGWRVRVYYGTYNDIKHEDGGIYQKPTKRAGGLPVDVSTISS